MSEDDRGGTCHETVETLLAETHQESHGIVSQRPGGLGMKPGRRRRVASAVHEAQLAFLQMAEEHPSSTAILAYDEPDTHLDYSSQRRLFSILEQQAGLDHVQVLVATHSMNFIR